MVSQINFIYRIVIMKYTTIYFSVLITITKLDTCQCFKVEVETKKFKNAVKTINPRDINFSEPKQVEQKRPMLTIVDDERYSPKIPSFTLFGINGMNSSNEKEDEEEVLYPSALPLSASIQTKQDIPVSTKLQQRKTCGLDDDPAEYWFHNKIHTFGNTGFMGMCHAVLAPLATALIDNIAYDGKDVRSMVSSYLNDMISKSNLRVMDLCCGVGMSTRALKSAFSDAELVLGVDTSPEMLSMAKAFIARDEIAFEIQSRMSKLLNLDTKNLSDDTKNIKYAKGNAERTLFPPKSFDLITIMYGFHEIPKLGRYRILREARRLLQTGGKLCVVDIAPEYQPSPSMLAGEPYVLEYKENIMQQLKTVQGFADFEYQVLKKGHVAMWLLTRK